jgi:hypothetical protein
MYRENGRSRSLQHRPIPLLGETQHLQTSVVNEAIHIGPPHLQIRDDGLHRRHALVPLVPDLVDADELQLLHAVLRVGDAVVEVGAPTVGGPSGGVLGVGEVFELRDA